MRKNGWHLSADRDINRPRAAATGQALHLSYILGCPHIKDGLDFVWVSFDAEAIDHETEELSLPNSKDALLWVQFHIERLKNVKRLL